MLKRIHHVAVICSNYEVSKRYDTEVLGLVLFADPDDLPLELYEIASPG